MPGAFSFDLLQLGVRPSSKFFLVVFFHWQLGWQAIASVVAALLQLGTQAKLQVLFFCG
jgi:hypothetical protein